MTDALQGSMDLDPEQPTTDDASLDRLRRFGGGKLLGQMIDLYLEAAPERMAAARAALEAADAPAVEMALHSLKSSSAQLGAFRMQRLCERGEREARAGTLDNAPMILRELDDELPRVVEWLEKSRSVEGS
jgi:HPt (histidine-containing phosphotransfer) domain-containing protein